MGSKHRRCDARCHSAQLPASFCKCWCGGLFHGGAGADARAAFVAAYGGDVPAESPQLSEPLLHWCGSSFTEAMDAARAAGSSSSEAA